MRAALGRVDGFKDMEPDVSTETVKVTYDAKKTTPEKLAQAITEHTTFEGSVKTQ